LLATSRQNRAGIRRIRDTSEKLSSDKIEDIESFNSFRDHPSLEGSAKIQEGQMAYVGPAKGIYKVNVELAGYVIYAILQRPLTLQLPESGKITFSSDKVELTRVRILRGSPASTSNIVDEEMYLAVKAKSSIPIIVLGS
jgi:hypothetical protein